MKELAARGNIEAETLIQYVIDDIKDDNNYKMILYDAKNLAEFEEKLRTYDDILKKMN